MTEYTYGAVNVDVMLPPLGGSASRQGARRIRFRFIVLYQMLSGSGDHQPLRGSGLTHTGHPGDLHGLGASDCKTKVSRRHIPTDSGIDETDNRSSAIRCVRLPLVSSYCTLAIGCAKSLYIPLCILDEWVSMSV